MSHLHPVTSQDYVTLGAPGSTPPIRIAELSIGLDDLLYVETLTTVRRRIRMPLPHLLTECRPDLFR